MSAPPLLSLLAIAVQGLLASSAEEPLVRLAPLARAPSRVSLSADFDEPQLIAGLFRLVEGALPIFERETGRPLPPGEKLCFNLYRSIGGYRRAARIAGVTGFMEIGAVTAWRTRESYLAVQPSLDAGFLASVGWMPDLLAQSALHEAVHQFLDRSGVLATAALPPWCSEGLADHLAERALREISPERERGWLLLDDARAQVARAVSRGSSIPLAELFAVKADEIDRRADRGLFYDQSRDVVSFLASGPVQRWREAFAQWLSEIGGLRRPEGSEIKADGEVHRARWLELVGDVGALERDWKASVAPASAEWIEVLGSTQWSGEELVTAALSWQEHGYVLASAPAPEPPRELSCQVAILGLGGGEAYVVLHAPAEDASGLKLSLRTDGTLSLVAWRDSNQDTRAQPCPTLKDRHGFVQLRIQIDGRELAVFLDDVPPIRMSVPEGFPAPGGAWGVGAWKDAARWREVSFR